MEKKNFTHKDMYNYILNEAVEGRLHGSEKIDTDDVIEFCEKQIEKLERANSRTKKGETAGQKENKRLAEIVVSVLRNATDGMTNSDIIASNDEFKGFSTSKMNAVLKVALTNGQITSSKIKGRTYFNIA